MVTINDVCQICHPMKHEGLNSVNFSKFHVPTLDTLFEIFTENFNR